MQRIIQPVLEMMAVASFVVHPGERAAKLLSFSGRWTALSVVVIHTAHQKFGWHIFGHVMHQSLTVQTDAEAVLHDKELMGSNRFKVTFYFSPSDFFQIVLRFHLLYLPVS